jgi:hypothetical protein
MILLDENVPEDQCQLLRKWRIRFRQIGDDIGRKGMKDEEHVLPLLHKLKKTTFATRDFGFFDERKRNAGYALVYLAVSQKEAAAYLRRFLRHATFNTKAKRLGMVACVGHEGVRFWRLGGQEEESVEWAD